jgi:RNA polymerase sigma factor (sigma-70 family)
MESTDIKEDNYNPQVIRTILGNDRGNGRYFYDNALSSAYRIFGLKDPDIEDVYQDFVLNCPNRSSKYDSRLDIGMNIKDEPRLKAWLMTSFLNECRVYLAKVKRRKDNEIYSLDISDLEEGESTTRSLERMILDCSKSPSEQLEEKERDEIIMKVVNGLEETERLVVINRYFKGQSYEEIVQTLGLPMGTVKSSIYYARALLKKRLSVIN